MDLFRQTTVVYELHGKRVKKETPGAVKRTIESKKWYATIKNEFGKRVNFPLSTDKRAAQAMLGKELSRIERKKAGVKTVEDFEDDVQPIDPLLDAYEAHLKAKGNAETYVSLTMSRLRETIAGCGFASVHDIDATTFTKWLNARKEHAKTASKNSPAKKLSQQTVIYFRSHLKSFVKWLIKSRKLAYDPLATIQVQTKVTERVLARRALSTDEIAKLLKAAAESQTVIRGLDGTARHALYVCALSTGLRAGGIASLTVGHFDLNADIPTVALSVKRDKSRRGKLQPIPESFVPVFREYLKGKPAETIAWPGTWIEKAAKIVRIDAVAAGLPITVNGPDGPEHLDFHALRHTYLTELGLSGVDLKSAQDLAGHSTPTLTAKYSHRRLQDLAAAANKLTMPTVKEEPPAVRENDGSGEGKKIGRKKSEQIITD
jgi:integrase/recombinase XerC